MAWSNSAPCYLWNEGEYRNRSGDSGFTPLPSPAVAGPEDEKHLASQCELGCTEDQFFYYVFRSRTSNCTQRDLPELKRIHRSKFTRPSRLSLIGPAPLCDNEINKIGPSKSDTTRLCAKPTTWMMLECRLIGDQRQRWISRASRETAQPPLLVRRVALIKCVLAP